MGEGCAAQALVPIRQVDEVELTAVRLEIGRDDLGDVGAHRVRRDDEGTRRFDSFITHLGRHRKRVLSAIDGDAELAHEVAHGLARIPHGRALAWKLGCPHPVGGHLDVSEGGDWRPHQIGQSLGDGEPGHRCRVEKALDRLLADRCGGSDRVGMRQSDDAAVGERYVQRPHALLLRDQAGHRAVDLVGQEALRTDRGKAKHAIECASHFGAFGELERLGHEGLPARAECLLRHLGKHELERQVDGRRAVERILEHDAPVGRHLAHERGGAVLARADGAEEGQRLGAQQQRAVLLVLGPPELKH